MVRPSSLSWLTRTIRKPGFWLLVIALVIITIPHYADALEHPTFLSRLMADFGLDRHAFERIAYLLPIIWAGFLFGLKGTIITSLFALACMLPRAIFFSPSPHDAIFETGAIFIVGNLVAFTFGSLRKEREYRTHLAALNQTSRVVSQSLDLRQILNSSIDNIMDVMNVDAVFTFLLHEEAGELTLAAHKGISPEFAHGVGRLKLGEGLNGMVAQTGEPAYVRDASKDPRLTKMEVRDENIQSQVIAPLKSKGKVMGTLCVAMHTHRQFRQDEIELLTAIGNQIGVAVENARLYEQERKVAEQLRASEERYRQLFESANDAIWVHDMDGNIISANDAASRLTGYGVEELSNTNVRSFLSEEGLRVAREIRTKLLNAEPVAQPYEQKLTTKQGAEAVLKLATNVVRVDGKPVGFQHIARDISQEKRMQDNLRFYLGQVTKAQEEERTRIARELHDDTIQELVVLSRQLDDIASSDKGLSEDKRVLLERLWQQTNNIMEGVRRLSQDLRPPTLDRLGLLPALEWLVSAVEKHSGMTVEAKVHGAERRLPVEVEMLLFRITQEALRNVERHSQATNVEVILEFDEGKTKITVKDNGNGFDPPEIMSDLVKDGRLGLAGMQERIQLLSGSLKIESKLGKGTTVTIEAPI